MAKHRWFLLWTLGLPFTVLGGSALVGAFRLAPGVLHDLLINLAAAFAGSIITVIYVDVVLQARQKRYWAGMRTRASKRVFAFANSCISSLRIAVNVKHQAVDGRDEATLDAKVLRDRMVRLATKVLPEHLFKISTMTQADWKTLNRGMHASLEMGDRLLLLFGKDFPPHLAEVVLDMHSSASKITGLYATWGYDVLGVPEAELKPNRDGESIVQYQRSFYLIARQAAGALLASCGELLKNLGDLPSE